MISSFLKYFTPNHSNITTSQDKLNNIDTDDAHHDITDDDIGANIDELIIIVGENLNIDDVTHNFDSLQVSTNYGLNHHDVSPIDGTRYDINDDNDDEPQYGTTFNNANDFTTSHTIKTLKFNNNFDELTFNNDYEYQINKFYWPILNDYQRTVTHADLEIPAPWYDIDDKLKIIDDEKKLKQAQTKKVLPVSSQQLAKINQLFHNDNDTFILKSNFQIDLTIRDIKTLKNKRWINDNIIDYYLSLICSIDAKYFSWTTHFFTTLESKGYQGVKRWGKRKKLNLFDKDIIFIPININSSHWALSIIDNRSKTIEYYDSLNLLGGSNILNTIKDYMVGEIDRLALHDIDINDWQLAIKSSPQQLNGYDCGIFTCVCAKYLSEGKDLTYSQNDMVNFRQRMIIEMLDDKFL